MIEYYLSQIPTRWKLNSKNFFHSGQISIIYSEKNFNYIHGETAYLSFDATLEQKIYGIKTLKNFVLFIVFRKDGENLNFKGSYNNLEDGNYINVEGEITDRKITGNYKSSSPKDKGKISNIK